MRRLLKILSVKSNVTSPYQIRQTIVFRPCLLKDRNLSSRVPAKEVLGNRVSEKFSLLWKFQKNSVYYGRC